MMNYRKWLYTVPLAIGLSLVSCASQTADSPKPSHVSSVSVVPPSGAINASELFANNCATCHGEQRQGRFRQGGALTPDRLKEISDTALINIISNGIQYAGMPTWRHKLSPDEIEALAKFIKYTTP